MAGRKDSGAAGDPLALWRNKDPLPLGEAAALLAGEPPGRRYYPKEVPEDRRAWDAVCAFRSELLAALVSKELDATVVPKKTGGERLNGVGSVEWLRDAYASAHEPRYAPVHTEVDWEKTKVGQADLRAWCEQREIATEFFCGRTESPSGDMTTRERETLLELVAALAELAGLDLRLETAGHAEAKKLAPELEARGVKTKAETVAKKLKEGRDLIRPKGPGRVTDSNSN